MIWDVELIILKDLAAYFANFLQDYVLARKKDLLHALWYSYIEYMLKQLWTLQ